jgi:hypothetical protein
MSKIVQFYEVIAASLAFQSWEIDPFLADIQADIERLEKSDPRTAGALAQIKLGVARKYYWSLKKRCA